METTTNLITSEPDVYIRGGVFRDYPNPLAAQSAPFKRVAGVLLRLLPLVKLTTPLPLELIVADNPEEQAAMDSFHSFLIVTTKLLEMFTTDGALAAVLGHEIAHNAIQSSDSPKGQYESDIFGIKLALRAGYPLSEIKQIIPVLSNFGDHESIFRAAKLKSYFRSTKLITD